MRGDCRPWPLQPQRSWLFWKHVVRGWDPAVEHDPPRPDWATACWRAFTPVHKQLPSNRAVRSAHSALAWGVTVNADKTHCQKHTSPSEKSPELFRVRRQHLLEPGRVLCALAPGKTAGSGLIQVTHVRTCGRRVSGLTADTAPGTVLDAQPTSSGNCDEAL